MNTLFGQGLVGMLAALAPAAPPPPPVVSITQSITEGATLTGSIAWTALPDPPPIKVDFLADGQVKWTEMTAPYVYNGDPGGLLDTNTLTNGTHTLVARAIYADGSTVSVSATVTIANVSPPRTVKISGRPVQGQTLTAVVA
jgi:hypothetical protein